MTSASTAGPPPNQPSSRNGGGPVGAHRAAINSATNGNNSPLKGAGRIFPHIDDLRASRPDVNIHSPIRTLLLQCESHAKQAETRLDFGRPDVALEEYMKASILLVEIIPRHKDYPELKSDRGDLHRLFAGLQKRISAQHQKFEEVKDVIKENNARNGVVRRQENGHAVNSSNATLSTKFDESMASNLTEQSTSAELRHILQEDGIHSSLDGIPAPPSTPLRNGEALSLRPKPPIQPKPDALHGNAIKPPVRPAAPGPSRSDEVAARFARLRGEQHSSGVVQDPRIRTQPIEMPDILKNKSNSSSTSTPKARPGSYQQRPERPSGPRDMPQEFGPLRPQKISLDSSIPSMPRPPDAIYSPARNFDNPANLDMPRTTPRSMFSGTGRLSSSSTTTSIGLDGRGDRTGNLAQSPSFDSRNDYFPLATFISKETQSKLSSKMSLPKSTTVTAEELMGYLKETRILVVDIRVREDFDSGHIMCQNIICIEPIVLRKDISAEDLAQSLVLSPDAEQRLFSQRDTFDLIIYYDSNSSDLRTNPNNYGHETALADFSKAIYDYGYEKKSKQPPLLLVGGLESWIDLLGPRALKTSMNITGPSKTSRKPYGQLPQRRMAMARRTTYTSRPLTREEESKWEQTVKNETLRDNKIHGSPDALGDGTTDEAFFVRTTEDFFRRFPEASAIPESMVSPVAVNNQSAHIAAARRDELNSMVPKIPARPAPALPRQSYTGVSDRDPGAVTTAYRSASISSGFSIPGPEFTISRPVGSVRSHCGLQNPGNLCYMNCIIQALSSTIPFTTWLLNYDFSDPKKIAPRKEGEVSDPPQLMAKNLANLLRHLWSRKWSYVTPQTFRDYVRAVARQQPDVVDLGGPDQQDAPEFYDFLMDVLIDETNMQRNVPLRPRSDAAERELDEKSLVQASIAEWRRSSIENCSDLFTNMFGSQVTTTRTCGICKKVVGRRMDPLRQSIQVQIPVGPNSKTLHQCLRAYFGQEKLDDYECGTCGTRGNSTQETRLSYCPEILVIQLARFEFKTKRAKKNKSIVTFDENLDMQPYFIDVPSGQGLARGQVAPFNYQLYAVVQHGGSFEGGHYWTIVRDQVSMPGTKRPAWYEFNDTNVFEVPSSKLQTAESYVLFFQRQPPGLQASARDEIERGRGVL